MAAETTTGLSDESLDRLTHAITVALSVATPGPPGILLVDEAGREALRAAGWMVNDRLSWSDAVPPRSPEPAEGTP